MSQQINLLARKTHGLGPMGRALAIMGLVLALLLGVWGIRQGQLASAKAAEAASASQLQQAEIKLKSWTLESGADLDADMAALKPRAEAAQRVLAKMAELGSQQGYAGHFSALTTITDNGLWLNSVAIEQGGKSVRIGGRALRKESVMRYAERLNGLYAGYSVQFTSLELTPEAFAIPGDPVNKLNTVAFKLY